MRYLLMDDQPNNQNKNNPQTPVILPEDIPSDPTTQEITVTDSNLPPILPPVAENQDVSLKPVTQATSVINSDLPPFPDQTEVKEENFTEERQNILNQPVDIQPETFIPESESKTEEPTLADFGIIAKAPQNNIFKIIFIFTFIIFITVSIIFAIVFIKNQKVTKSDSTSDISPTTTPSSEICLLNDKKYFIGETFAAADGCNTCTCREGDNITCTNNKCLSTTPATKSATTVTPTQGRTTTSTSSSIKK